MMKACKSEFCLHIAHIAHIGLTERRKSGQDGGVKKDRRMKMVAVRKAGKCEKRPFSADVADTADGRLTHAQRMLQGAGSKGRLGGRSEVAGSAIRLNEYCMAKAGGDGRNNGEARN